MKKIQYFIAFCIVFVANISKATHYEVWISSAGLSTDTVNTTYGDTVTIHATTTYPMRRVSYANWLIGDASAGSGIRTTDYDVVASNATNDYYYLCTTQPFKLLIHNFVVPTVDEGVKVVPCPIQNTCR